MFKGGIHKHFLNLHFYSLLTTRTITVVFVNIQILKCGLKRSSVYEVHPKSWKVPLKRKHSNLKYEEFKILGFWLQWGGGLV